MIKIFPLRPVSNFDRMNNLVSIISGKPCKKMYVAPRTKIYNDPNEVAYSIMQGDFSGFFIFKPFIDAKRISRAIKIRKHINSLRKNV